MHFTCIVSILRTPAEGRVEWALSILVWCEIYSQNKKFSGLIALNLSNKKINENSS